LIDSAKNGDRVRDRYIAALAERHTSNSETTAPSKNLLRIPSKSGELFVSADPDSPTSNGIQADLNAAANIGLRAVMDPDWSGAWWYVPVKSVDGTTDTKDFPGCPLFERPMQLLAEIEKEAKQSDDGSTLVRAREKTYAWSNISGKPLASRGTTWKTTPHYWNSVEFEIIEQWAGKLRLQI
jgi:hypothetical protein